MCGRLVIVEPDLSVLVEPFDVAVNEVAEWLPRYNLAPTQPAPLITNEPQRRVTLAQFGLLSRQKDKPGHKLINARVEGVARSRTFGKSLRVHRGIIPVTGYYEWTTVAGKRQPQFIHHQNGKPLALAALWELEPAPSFAILTRPAEGFLATIHSRMPLTLQAAQIAQWLTPEETDPTQLEAILQSPPDIVDLRHDAASPRANSPRNDDPTCLDAPPPPPQLTLFE